MKKTTKVLAFGVGLTLMATNSIAISQEFRYKALENIRLSFNNSNGESVSNGESPLEDVIRRPNDGIDPVPVCDYNLGVGEIDCFGRLYVDRSMLEQLINNQSAYSIDGDEFNEYSHHQINTYHINDMSTLFQSKNVRFDIYEWDVSNVTNMENLFNRSTNFNQPIGNWDVSNVINMSAMFHYNSAFNQDIGNWNTENVKKFDSMFYFATNFNQDLTDWNVCDFGSSAYFSGYSGLDSTNLPYFDKKNCINKNYDELEFRNGKLVVDRGFLDFIIGNPYNQLVTKDGLRFPMTYSHNDIDVSSVTDMSELFWGKAVDFDIYKWDVRNVTNMNQMFRNSNFNQPIGNWDVSNVINMSTMFYYNSAFNQDIGNWNTKNVKKFDSMFYFATNFNQDLTSWNVCDFESTGHFGAYSGLDSANLPYFDKKNCINKNYDELEFRNGKLVVDREFLDFIIDNPYNQLITKDGLRFPMTYSHNDIDVSNVTDMSELFMGKTVDFDIYEWDVSNVITMNYMFQRSPNFNQDIGNWDVSNVMNMSAMFHYNSAFNQDIGNWNTENVKKFDSMFYFATNFNHDLTGWNVCNFESRAYFSGYSGLDSANLPFFDKRNCN